MQADDPWYVVKQTDYDLDQTLRESHLDRATFSEWITARIVQSGMPRSEVLRRAHINPTYGYQILSGKRRATRDKLLQLAFGMGLSVEDTCELLERGGTNALSPHVKRDVAIAYCLARDKGVLQCSETLRRAGLRGLCPDDEEPYDATDWHGGWGRL